METVSRPVASQRSGSADKIKGRKHRAKLDASCARAASAIVAAGSACMLFAWPPRFEPTMGHPGRMLPDRWGSSACQAATRRPSTAMAVRAVRRPRSRSTPMVHKRRAALGAKATERMGPAVLAARHRQARPATPQPRQVATMASVHISTGLDMWVPSARGGRHCQRPKRVCERRKRVISNAVRGYRDRG
jgi:hypothetical protein